MGGGFGGVLNVAREGSEDVELETSDVVFRICSSCSCSLLDSQKTDKPQRRHTHRCIHTYIHTYVQTYIQTQQPPSLILQDLFGRPEIFPHEVMLPNSRLFLHPQFLTLRACTYPTQASTHKTIRCTWRRINVYRGRVKDEGSDSCTRVALGWG